MCKQGYSSREDSGTHQRGEVQCECTILLEIHQPVEVFYSRFVCLFVFVTVTTHNHFWLLQLTVGKVSILKC